MLAVPGLTVMSVRGRSTLSDDYSMHFTCTLYELTFAPSFFFHRKPCLLLQIVSVHEAQTLRMRIPKYYAYHIRW